MKREDIYQVELIDWIENEWGNEIMIPILGSISNRIIDSYLVPKDTAKNELEDVSRPTYNLKPGFDLGGEEGNQYTRFCNFDGIEPLIISQNFGGIYEDKIELVEEFRLLFNLYYDHDECKYIDPKTRNDVVTIKNNEFVYVHKKYLKSYLAVKGMALIMYLNYQKLTPVDNESWKSISCENLTENSRYELHIGSCESGNFTTINAKK